MAYPVDLNETYLIEPFGTTAGREIPHTGDDFARRKVGGVPVVSQPRVKACFSGTVIHAGWRGVAGNLVAIRYWFGRIGGYAHLAKISVKLDQAVTEGQQIGLLGGTGKTSGPHLHYSQHTEAGLKHLLSGFFPYWKDARTGRVLWSSVDAWAANAGLLRPDYKTGGKTSAENNEEDDMNENDRKTLNAIKNDTANVQRAVGRLEQKFWSMRTKLDGLGTTITEDAAGTDPEIIAAAVVEALGKDAAKIVADRLIVRIDAK